MDQYVSNAQLFSIFLPSSVIALCTTFSLSVGSSHFCIQTSPSFEFSLYRYTLSPFPFFYLSFHLSNPALGVQIIFLASLPHPPPLFTHHSSLLAPFPRFLPHDHSPFGKFIFLILNQRLHHHVALFLTLFFLTETASLLFPFSPPLTFSRRRESIPVHSQSVTAAL